MKNSINKNLILEKDVEELQRDKHAIMQIYSGEPEAFIIIVSCKYYIIC
jgi:hypothetical protein